MLSLARKRQSVFILRFVVWEIRIPPLYLDCCFGDCAHWISALYSSPTSCKILPGSNWHSVDGPSSTRGDMSAPTFVTRIRLERLWNWSSFSPVSIRVFAWRASVIKSSCILFFAQSCSHVSLEVVWRSRETNIVLDDLSQIHVSLKYHLYMWTSLWSLRCKQQLLVRQIHDRLKTDILQSVSPVQRSLPS